MAKVPGVYQIKNIENWHVYVGSAVDIKRRWWQHKNGLNNGKHPNPHLQNAWNKYGAKAFKFSILEEILDKTMLIKNEQKWIDFMMPEYNICLIAGSRLGSKASEETKQKMSVAKSGENNHMYGKKTSEETKKKMSVAQSGENNHMYGKTGENHPRYGKKHSKETKKKMSENHADVSGENNPRYGKKASEETKKKMSESHKGLSSGENNPSAKLSWDIIAGIRAKYIPYKYTQQMLAEEYGVGQTTIHSIINNKLWKENK